MLVYASARNLADVHADVEAVRLHELGQRADALLRERRHLGELVRRQRRDVRGVAVGYDHKMPRVVGIRVHYHETILAALDYHALLVLVAFGEFAEDAAVDLLLVV